MAQRVAVIAVPAPPQLKTEIALKVVGTCRLRLRCRVLSLAGRRDWNVQCPVKQQYRFSVISVIIYWRDLL